MNLVWVVPLFSPSFWHKKSCFNKQDCGPAALIITKMAELSYFHPRTTLIDWTHLNFNRSLSAGPIVIFGFCIGNSCIFLTTICIINIWIDVLFFSLNKHKVVLRTWTLALYALKAPCVVEEVPMMCTGTRWYAQKTWRCIQKAQCYGQEAWC